MLTPIFKLLRFTALVGAVYALCPLGLLANDPQLKLFYEPHEFDEFFGFDEETTLLKAGVPSKSLLAETLDVYLKGVARRWDEFDLNQRQAFFEDVEKGHYRANFPGFGSIKLTIGNSRKRQIIVKIMPKGSRIAILVLNPPLPMNSIVLKDTNPQIRKFQSRLLVEKNLQVLMVDYRSNELVPLTLTAPSRRFLPKWWKKKIHAAAQRPAPKEVAIGFVAAGYEIAILGSSLYWMAKHFPETMQFSSLALQLKYAYLFLCTTFSDAYDRLVKDEYNKWRETAFRVALVLPFNVALLGLTTGWANWPVFVLSLPISIFEKLTSSFMIEFVRFPEEQRLLRGYYQLRLGHLSPLHLLKSIRWNGLPPVTRGPGVNAAIAWIPLTPQRNDGVYREPLRLGHFSPFRMIHAFDWGGVPDLGSRNTPAGKIRHIPVFFPVKRVIFHRLRLALYRRIAHTIGIVSDPVTIIPIGTALLGSMAVYFHDRALQDARHLETYWQREGDHELAEYFRRKANQLESQRQAITTIPAKTKSALQRTGFAITGACKSIGDLIRRIP